MRKADYVVEKETDKAVYVCVKDGYCQNVIKYKWLPKSCVELETYVRTLNALNEPETYGKKVVKIADWLAREIAKM